MINPLMGVWLSFEEGVLNSPFKSASLGWKISVPNENSYLIRGNKDNWKSWYKVTLPEQDTVLFLDSTAFIWESEELSVNSISFSQVSDKLLIKTQSKKIWRHSNYGTYFAYDLNLETLIPISKNNMNLRNVKFSPNGELVAYVREDNNLYFYEFKRNREKQLTKTGSKRVSNGHFGWLYEKGSKLK